MTNKHFSHNIEKTKSLVLDVNALPPLYSETASISKDVLVLIKQDGDLHYFGTAYLKYYNQEWSIREGNVLSLPITAIKEWWPIPEAGTGTPPNEVPALGGALCLIREYKTTVTLKLALYEKDEISLKGNFYGFFNDRLRDVSSPVYEWFPVPEIGTGIKIEYNEEMCKQHMLVKL
jgi:hypothetical protein